VTVGRDPLTLIESYLRVLNIINVT